MVVNTAEKARSCMRAMVAVLAATALIFSMAPATAHAADNIAPLQGFSNNGHTCTWQIDGDGKLIVMGEVDLSGADASTAIYAPWNGYRSKITSVHFASGASLHGDVRYLFGDCSNLTHITGLKRMNTTDVFNMSSMFQFCSSLEFLDLSGFDTSNVTNMPYMFFGCSSLTSLDLSGFDTSNVINMYGMFLECSSLESLDLTGLDTSNVINMDILFGACSKLKSLDLSGFNTSNVVQMTEVFYGCSSLKSLDLSGWDTSNVTIMFDIFRGTSGLEELRLGKGWKPTAEDTGLSDGWYEDTDCDGYADRTDRTLLGLQVVALGSNGLARMGYVKSPALKPAVPAKPADSDKAASDADAAIPAAAAVEKRVLAMKSDKDVAGSTFAILQARASKTAKTSVTIKWAKVKGATKYVVYGNKCGKKNRYEKLKTVKASKTGFKHKKLKAKTYYKYIVVAVGNANGTEAALATSKTVHAATKGSSKKANPTKVKPNKKRLSLKKGKSSKLKAKQLKKRGAKVSAHCKVAYESSNPNVATVSSKGRVTAKGKGTAYVFAYAQNGVFAKVKVTVG